MKIAELWRGNCTFRESQDDMCLRCRVRRYSGWLRLRRWLADIGKEN